MITVDNSTKVHSRSSSPAFGNAMLQAVPTSDVYLMDCIQGMKHYPDKWFDLAVVDPPYGINFGTFNRTNKDSNGNRYKANKYKQGNWDETIPQLEYFTELVRVSKIKLFGVVIISLAFGNLVVNVLFFGISKTQYQIFLMVKWLGLLLTNLLFALITDIMVACKVKQVPKAKYTQHKSLLNYTTSALILPK